MKKLSILSAIVFVLAFNAFVSGQTAAPAAPNAVTTLDPAKFAGKWYEIAAFSNNFQRKCIANITMTYTLKKNGVFDVVNECLETDGTTKTAKGSAKIAKKTAPGKMKIRFSSGFFSFLPGVWEDHWVIDLDKNYEYAVIGGPKREYLWVISRKPEMSDAQYQDILRRIEDQGYNPAKFLKTPQNKEAIRGATIEN